MVNLGRDSGLEVAVMDGGHGGAGRCLVDVRICTTPRPLLRERTDGDCRRRRTLRGAVIVR